jgi:hypothetical protein
LLSQPFSSTSSSDPKLTVVAGSGDSFSAATQVSVLSVLAVGLLLIFLATTAEGIVEVLTSVVESVVAARPAWGGVAVAG